MVVVIVGCNGDLRPDYVLTFLQNSDRVSLSTRISEKPRCSVVIFIAAATFPHCGDKKCLLNFGLSPVFDASTSALWLYVLREFGLDHFKNVANKVFTRTKKKGIVYLKNKRPTWCHLLFYFTSYVLNMFRTLIYPSSETCDYSVELPHWSYCSWFDVCWSFGVVGLEWYPCCRLKPATRVPLQHNHTETPTHIEPRTIRPMW